MRFSDQIDPDTRTMHTEVDVPNPKYVIVPGMYATVEIPLQTVQNALTVPVQAVQSSAEGRGTVLVVGPDDRIESRDVTMGIESSTDAEVSPACMKTSASCLASKRSSSPANWSCRSCDAFGDELGAFMSSFSLRHPYFIVVVCLFVCVLGLTAWCRCRWTCSRRSIFPW